MPARPFEIRVPDAALEDLRARLALTRWPATLPARDGWELGSDPATMRRLVAHWRDGFDWRAREREMNALPHFLAEVDGADVHFLHYRAQADDPLPIVITHGWPGCFLEVAPLAERLARAGFDVVAPSLPGFAFSAPRPQRTDPWSTPDLWHTLMTDTLGYERYAAHGGDLGAGVTSRLAARRPGALIGIHLLAVGAPQLGEDARLTPAEQAHLAAAERWEHQDGAYEHEQMTRPLTLAYGLSDSPAGLLAWLLEKYREWSDSGGDVSTRFSDDDLLTWVSLYWLTNTIATSFRPYNDAYAFPAAAEPVTVPTALAVFPHDLERPPREWAQRRYALARYTEMPRGGHFAAFEEPDLLAQDIVAFFASLPRD